MFININFMANITETIKHFQWTSPIISVNIIVMPLCSLYSFYSVGSHKVVGGTLIWNDIVFIICYDMILQIPMAWELYLEFPVGNWDDWFLILRTYSAWPLYGFFHVRYKITTMYTYNYNTQYKLICYSIVVHTILQNTILYNHNIATY